MKTIFLYARMLLFTYLIFVYYLLCTYRRLKWYLYVPHFQRHKWKQYCMRSFYLNFSVHTRNDEIVQSLLVGKGPDSGTSFAGTCLRLYTEDPGSEYQWGHPGQWIGQSGGCCRTVFYTGKNSVETFHILFIYTFNIFNWVESKDVKNSRQLCWKNMFFPM